MGSKCDEVMGEINRLQHNYDSALFYFLRSDSSKENRRIGEMYLLKKDYSKALPYLSKPLEIATRINNVYDELALWEDLSKAYAGQKNHVFSLKYAITLFNTAKSVHAREFIKSGAGALWKIYACQQQIDSAYKYRLEFDNINDSIAKDNLARNIVVAEMNARDEQKQSQFDILARNNKISQQQLQRESLLKKIFLAEIFILFLLGALIFFTMLLRQKNEKLKNMTLQSDLRRRATELEMQALRAQMSPHFIFNSLNSINRFILQNNRQQASEYLTKFFRLVRQILQNSQATLITIESELEALSLYIEMEALRFNHHLTYKIHVSREVDISVLKIPPLIIQPYAENAIWHGLMHKEEKGHLDIELWEENKNVFIKIKDDGVGRKHASARSGQSLTNHKSMGLKITGDRISMLLNEDNSKSNVSINDLTGDDGNSAGTEVIIKMNAIYD